VLERVEQTNDVFPARMLWIGLHNAVQQFDLIDSGLGIVRGGAYDLERHMPSVGGVAREPDGGKVTPSELTYHDISTVLVCLAHADGVVPAFAVIFRVFLFRRIFGALGFG
jgi:hypothetical protein